MAVVPYQPNTEVAPSLRSPIGYQSTDVNANMFGAQQGRAMEVAGARLQSGVDAMSKALEEQQALTNETMAKEAALKGVQDITNAELEYKQLKGKDAQDGLGAYQERIQQIRAQALATMPNPQAARMLDSVMFRYLGSGLQAGATHAVQQGEVWRKETAAGTAQLAYNQGVYNSDDPAKVAAFATTMEQNIRQQYAGQAPEFIDAKVAEGMGHYYKTVLDQIAITDPSRALAYFQTVRSKLSGTSAQAIEQELTTRSRTFDARNLVNGWVTENGGGSGPAPSDPEGRARYIFDRARQAGFSDAGAASVVAQVKHESNFDPTLSHDGGIGTGILGWNGDRRRQLEAKYGKNPTFEQQVDFLLDELRGGGDRGMAQVGPAVRGATNAGQAAADLSSIGVRPRDVEGNRTARAATAEQYMRQWGGTPGTATIEPPKPWSPEALRAYVLTQTEGKPELRDTAMAYAEHQITLQNHQLAGDRAKLSNQLQDLGAALRTGTVDSIPAQVVADVHRLLPAADATEKLRDLDVMRQAGLVSRAAEFASPQEVAQLRAAIDTGSLTSEMKARNPQLAAVVGEGGADNFRLRQSVLQQFDQAQAVRETALKHDPAQYAIREPGTMAAYRAWQAASDNQKLAAFQAFNTKLLATQSQMGVMTPRLLTNGQVAEMANKFVTTGPESGQMVQVLKGYQQQYGNMWPKAYGELVQHGKIPEGYRILADLDQPSQVTTATDYQRVLTQLAQPNGRKVLVENAVGRSGNRTAERDVEDRLNRGLADFQQTTSFSSGGQRLYATVRDATTNLALFYMGRDGMSAKAAADKAIDGMLTTKWGMSDTMIYPKPLEDRVLSATRQTTRDLTADALAVPPSTPLMEMMKPEERSAAWLAAAQRGKWVPNDSATGLVLMAQVQNGGMIPVRRKDGTVVSLSFDNLPAPDRNSREEIRNPYTIDRYGAGTLGLIPAAVE